MNTQLKKILIVDDEAKDRELLKVMLKAEDYELASANSGEAALVSVEQTPPDLILLDVMMPEMNGNKVVGILKHNPNTKSIPVIMVTALDSRDSKMAAFSLGAEEFVTKPVDRAELLLRVRNMLRLKDYSDLLCDYNKTLQAKVQERTAELENAYQETILTMVRAAEYQDEDTGYPNGISGKAIPLSARIMSLCDVYDALRSKRPYKPAFSHEKTVKIILEGDGRTKPEHFDPTILAAFATHPEYFEQIYEQYKEE